MNRHVHNWKEVARDKPTETLHLDTYTMTTEVYVKYKCNCGKEEIRATQLKAKS